MSPSRIDITDVRFKIAANHDVMEFIRRTNPSAHSDPGDVMFKLGRSIAGARSYCPSTAAVEAAVANGGTPATEIGANWVAFPPFNARGESGAWERLERWSGQAFAQADAQDRVA